MTGDLTVPNLITSGNVDGRDVSVDGTKLDGIEAGATADQTAAEILTAINTVDGSGSGLDADLLDGQHGAYYQPAATAITTSNIGSQSVSYAASAGNADTVDGNHATAFATAAQGALADSSIQPTDTQLQATWEAGTSTTESLVSPAKVSAAVAALASSVPAGAVVHFAMNTAPTGWLKANGAAVSRTTYATLFAAIGTTFGVGNGSTTFNLPDLRGEFLRSWDDGSGVDSGRSFGSAQSFAMQNITATADFVANGSSGSQILSSASGAMSKTSVSVTDIRTSSGASISTGSRLTLNASTQVQTAAETRPRNIALLACIKY